MAEVKSTGPSTATIILIAVLATPVVLVVIFWLIGSGSADAKSSLPDLKSKGLQWATSEAKDAGFGDIETHDALGRDRRWRDNKEWMVCFQDPAAGSHVQGTVVKLGVVKTEERCPSADQGRYDRAVKTMPDLTNRTAYMTEQILGPDASIRFLKRTDGEEVNHGLGDWRVCGQTPKTGQRFDGLPVTTIVVPYETRC
jgi:beta-lactam-binding protein with PASTA domain